MHHFYGRNKDLRTSLLCLLRKKKKLLSTRFLLKVVVLPACLAAWAACLAVCLAALVSLTSLYWSVSQHEMLCTICHHFYNFKNVKNIHKGVLLLVNLPTEAYNFIKSNPTPGMFFTFFELSGTESRKASHCQFLKCSFLVFEKMKDVGLLERKTRF